MIPCNAVESNAQREGGFYFRAVTIITDPLMDITGSFGIAEYTKMSRVGHGGSPYGCPAGFIERGFTGGDSALRAAGGCGLRSFFESADHIDGGGVEAVGEAHEGGEARFAGAAFEVGDKGAVHVAPGGEFFLGESPLRAEGAQHGAEAYAQPRIAFRSFVRGGFFGRHALKLGEPGQENL